MNVKFTRRSVFNGLLAMSTLRFMPATPASAAVEPGAVNTLNPFALGNSDRLSEMVVALLEDQHKVETIAALRSVPSFNEDMLTDIAPDESAADALTRNLGDGEWTKWPYSVDEVRDALASLDRRFELLRQTMKISESVARSNSDILEAACRSL